MDSLENKIQTQGQQIFEAMGKGKGASIFNKDWWYGRIMEWSMKNEHFKTQMFRFVDVFPYLTSSEEISRHLKEYFADKNGELPSFLNLGMGMGNLAPNLMAGAIRKNIQQMAKMFITGENPQETLAVLKKARKNDLAFTVDILGEATLSEEEAKAYQSKYLELIDWLANDGSNWKPNLLLDENHQGTIPPINISVKLSSIYSQINIKAWERTKTALKDRLRPIFDRAMEKNVFINVDMEHYEYKNLTLEVFQELIVEPAYKDYPHWGIVIQAYLRDSLVDTQQLTDLAMQRKVPFTVRLVKGAYWDYETIAATQNDWPIPVYTNKKESDANFEECAFHLLDHWEHISLAIGSHNVRSVSSCLVYAQERGIPKKALEIQMLYGMADPIKRALIKEGYRVREYAPMGDLIPGMAYLVRRLLENTSNESFLRSKFAENTDSQQLLQSPKLGLTPSNPKPQHQHPFYNEPLFDFTEGKHRQEVQNALDSFSSTQLGARYPLHINGEDISSQETLTSVNPAQPDMVVGIVDAATEEHAAQAIEGAKKAQSQWAKRPVAERCEFLNRIAERINERRNEFIAAEVYETGKPWSEADGDVAEAIDFCRYYAQDMARLAAPRRVGAAPGEISLYHYRARGVAAVIAPWNFPLAILCGMAVGPLVAGNTVIIKPAEQSSVVASLFCQVLKEVDLPSGVFQFLPGVGEVVGEYLVNHPNVDLISFTGSKAVGLEILKKASLVHTDKGQAHVKKCIIEMGGKNAVIVDSDADMDEAVKGVVYSAFGFAGQKCSACSRVIVLEDNYDRFVHRLVEATRSIIVEDPLKPEAYLGPVIDEQAQQRILQTIEKAKTTSRLAFQGAVPDQGYFVPPTIFTDVDPQSDLAQNEIFGPVLAVIKAQDLDEALKIANGTAYALTGGIYSRSPAHIKRAQEEFEVGNLYINRGITGALVDRHPFGGFKLSGVGSKTGGPDYLINFMEPRCITENTLRRGFAPSEEEALDGLTD